MWKPCSTWPLRECVRRVYTQSGNRQLLMVNMAMQYIRDDTGTYIPATQRPDGTWRKARRVKDGYIPQDEMPLYESKGKQWAKNKPDLPIGLDPLFSIPAEKLSMGSKKIPGLDNSRCTDPSNPPSKKKKKKKGDSSAKHKDIIDGLDKLDISSSDKTSELRSSTIEKIDKKTHPITIDPAKRLRNLRKKLKDINALKLKIESGELSNPDKDQLEKVRRKDEIEGEIEDLELQLELE